MPRGQVRSSYDFAGPQGLAQAVGYERSTAVLEHSPISDAGGLIDALPGGSDFSFGDLTANRADVRFVAATGSESVAKAMQLRLQNALATDHFFPPTVDFPKDLTVDEFRRDSLASGVDATVKSLARSKSGGRLRCDLIPMGTE